MNKCQNCNNEFNPIHLTRGCKQIYCSIKCRTSAYHQRSKYKKNIVIEMPSKNFSYEINNKNFIIDLIIDSLQKNKQQ